MIGKPLDLINWLYSQEKDKTFEVKEKKNKRSLNANAYLWVLCTEIANQVRLSKEEVYLNMLKHYGQSEIVSIVSSLNLEGYFKYYEVVGISTLGDKEFKHIRVFKGSSQYDTKEMSILIDGVVQECTNLGIPTITGEELNKLKGSWKNDKMDDKGRVQD
ncbi:MAG: recombination protein NinB [Bacilli bacterium]|nr:recombination protein NinB [Bacilli bacterium]